MLGRGLRARSPEAIVPLGDIMEAKGAQGGAKCGRRRRTEDFKNPVGRCVRPPPMVQVYRTQYPCTPILWACVGIHFECGDALGVGLARMGCPMLLSGRPVLRSIGHPHWHPRSDAEEALAEH